jgi:hypothetical protein
MSQADAIPGQNGVIERPYGEYKVRTEGNSMTVTVPRAFPLASQTDIIVRAGVADDTLLYLKAIPLKAAFDNLPGTEKTTKTVDGVTVTEEKIDLYSVRGGDSPDKSITIPKKCDTGRFPEKSYPKIVAGRTEAGVAYLRLIPECVHSVAESTSLRDIVQAIAKPDS